LGFVSQLEGFALSSEVLRHIITDEKKQYNSSSYVCDMNEISKLMLRWFWKKGSCYWSTWDLKW
jgi:hypothetical protein